MYELKTAFNTIQRLNITWISIPTKKKEKKRRFLFIMVVRLDGINIWREQGESRYKQIYSLV